MPQPNSHGDLEPNRHGSLEPTSHGGLEPNNANFECQIGLTPGHEWVPQLQMVSANCGRLATDSEPLPQLHSWTNWRTFTIWDALDVARNTATYWLLDWLWH